MKKYIQAIAIWGLIIPIAIINGIFRERVLVNLDFLSRPLSGVILSFAIFLVAYYLIPKIKGASRIDYFMFGVIWFLLTNLFDYLMFVITGGGLSKFLASYHFTGGNLWLLVVLTALFSPYLVAIMRNLME